MNKRNNLNVNYLKTPKKQHWLQKMVQDSSALPFRRRWSHMFYAKKCVFLKCC